MKRLVVLVITIVSFLFGCKDEGSGGAKKVLIVHSYHEAYQWTKDIDNGVRSVFPEGSVEIKSVFMDTKRKAKEEDKVAAGENAMQITESFQPDVIVTSDDNAQQYYGKDIVAEGKIPLVFCGVNAEPVKYNYTDGNVTGILERAQIVNSLDLLNKLKDGISSYTLITDKSPTSDAFLDYLDSLELDIKLDKIIKTDDFDEWKKEVAAIKSDAVITWVYHTLNKDGEHIDPAEVMQWTVDTLKVPTVGFLNFAITDGVLIGNVESGFEHGELAGKYAKDILEGKLASELPIITASKGAIMVNAKTAKKLNIDITPVKPVADEIIE